MSANTDISHAIFPAMTTAYGISTTVNGITEVVDEGNLQKGTLDLLRGAIAIPTGMYLQNAPEKTLAACIHGSLLCGTIMVCVSGVKRFFESIGQSDLKGGLRAISQAALGAFISKCLFDLDSKIISIAHQTSVLGLSGSWMILTGSKDLKEGAYKRGLLKTIVGICGIAVSGYCIYQFIQKNGEISEIPKDDALPEQLDLFLRQHQTEIEQLYQKYRSVGRFSKIGSGRSKYAYQHPDSNFLLKIPHAHFDLLKKHYENWKDAKQIVNHLNLNRIVLPEMYWVETSSGPIVAEEKFQFESSWSMFPKKERDEAFRQFDVLLSKGRFCDIWEEHNSAFLKEKDAKIAVFDFDCREEPIAPEPPETTPEIFMAAPLLFLANTLLFKKSENKINNFDKLTNYIHTIAKISAVIMCAFYMLRAWCDPTAYSGTTDAITNAALGIVSVFMYLLFFEATKNISRVFP